MTIDQDERPDTERIGRLLREDAPAERDALFRLSVLERREKQRYQRRSALMIVAAIVLAALIGFGFGSGADPFTVAAIAGLCIALVAFAALSVPGVMHMTRLLRDLQRSSGKN